MANNNIFSITCPTTCPSSVPFTSAIEDVDVNCQVLPNKSEIYTVLMQDPTLGTGVVDWTDPAEWATAIDNSDTTGAKVRQFLGTGDKPAPERTDIPLAAGRVSAGIGTYTLNFTITSLTTQLRDFLRKFQCGKSFPKFWYATESTMYGKDVEGIQSSKITVEFINDRGQDSYERAEITIEWNAQIDPDFTANVLAS